MAKDFYGDEIPPGGHEISKLWLAMKALDRREFDECLGYCNAVLEKNPYDQVRPPPRSFSSLDADFHHPSHPSDLVPPLHPFPSQQDSDWRRRSISVLVSPKAVSTVANLHVAEVCPSSWHRAQHFFLKICVGSQAHSREPSSRRLLFE